MGKGVLVAYASKHGATREIAERIARILTEKGVVCTPLPAEEATEVATYDAVIAGSAVYIGKMRKEMRRFLSKNEQVLHAKPLWLFASGPTKKGDDPGELDGWHRPASMKDLIDRLAPKDRVVFAGAVTLDKMGGLEKWMMSKVKAPLEDAREWDKIETWATGIAADLKG